MNRDWKKAFRPASFRGVGFEVEVEEVSGRPRLSIGAIAYADHSAKEHLGLTDDVYVLTAYMAGSVADFQALALVPALKQKGPGRLTLPMFPPVQARVTSWTINRQKSINGYVAIDIELIDDTGGIGGFSASKIKGSYQVAASLDAFAAIAGGIAMDFSKDADAGVSRGAGKRLARAMAALGLDDDEKTATAAEALDPAFGPVLVDASRFSWNVASSWKRVSLNADPTLALTFLAGEITGKPASPASAVEHIAMIGARSVAAMRKTFRERADAVSERERLNALHEAFMEAGADLVSNEALDWLNEAVGAAADHISRTAANLAPLVRVEFGRSLPSVAAAYRLYGDPSRADDLIRRTGGALPVFLPATIITEAPDV